MARNLLKPFLITVFCILAAWFCAKTGSYFLAPSPPPLMAQPAKGKNGLPPSLASTDAPYGGGEDILKRNLFHAALNPPASANDEEENSAQSAAREALLREEMGKLPISKQGWTLVGTIVNTLVPQDSRAILLVNNEQNAYGQGADLNGWKIALIERRTIVVEKSGRRERLLVGGKDIAAPAAPQTGARKKSLNARDIQKALNNIPELMREAGFSPTQKEGVYGLNVTFVKPESFMAKLGLKRDDLLTAANGQNLTSLGDLAALNNLASQNSLRLELVRNGENMVIEYDINR